MVNEPPVLKSATCPAVSTQRSDNSTPEPLYPDPETCPTMANGAASSRYDCGSIVSRIVEATASEWTNTTDAKIAIGAQASMASFIHWWRQNAISSRPD